MIAGRMNLKLIEPLREYIALLFHDILSNLLMVFRLFKDEVRILGELRLSAGARK